MTDINNMSDQELKGLEERFLRAMVAAYNIFEDRAFRKFSLDWQKRSPINKALFEAWSVNLDQLNDEQLQILKEHRAKLPIQLIQLEGDPAFWDAISQGTGDIKKVKLRFGAVKKLIEGVLS